MTEEEKNIEGLFRDRFSEYKIEPSEGLWSSIRWKLALRDFFSFSFTQFNVWYALVGGGLLAGLFYVGIEVAEPDPVVPFEEEVPEEIVTLVEPEYKDTTVVFEVIEPEPLDSVVHELFDSVTIDTSEYRIEAIPDTTEVIESKQINSEEFDEILVKADSFAKPIITEQDTVAEDIKPDAEESFEINQKPEAIFEIQVAESTGFGRTVYFYNYSLNAESYIWDFGDGNRSISQNPTHTYLESGNFSVSLTAISENGYEDKMVVENIFSDEEYFILFPNAFMPDMGGPSDGTYNPADPVTKVFYPQYKGVVEYNLTIYNKSGLLLFETNDISIGWNGYYNHRLVSPDVYIWQARGRFENGQPFVKAGDVTVILNN